MHHYFHRTIPIPLQINGVHQCTPPKLTLNNFSYYIVTWVSDQGEGSIFILYFVLTSFDPYHAHSSVVKLQTHNRGHWYTKIFPPYCVRCPTFYPLPSARSRLLLPLHLFYSPVLLPVRHRQLPPPLAPARSSPYCSYHLIETQAPSIWTNLLQRSRIDCIVIHCTTMFCLFMI